MNTAKLIIGVDECGVGAIAGPMVLAAVAFRTGTRQPVLKRFAFEKGPDIPVQDSKKVKAALIPRLVELIWDACVDYELLVRPAAEVDSLGAHAAQIEGLKAVTHRLLERIALQRAGEFNDYNVIVDGEISLGKPCTFRYHARAHADQDVWQVGAASLIAKNRQLEVMRELHAQDSRYGFDKHAGYPTPAHKRALQQYGVSRFHRRTYRTVKEFL